MRYPCGGRRSPTAAPRPIREWSDLYRPLDERVPEGFGGVSEYGITVRWDKNFLTLLHLTLARRKGGGGLYVRRGVLRHHVWAVPIERFQVFYASASIFQRRLKLKSVYVDTAGAGSLGGPEIHDLQRDDADRLFEHLYVAFQSTISKRPAHSIMGARPRC